MDRRSGAERRRATLRGFMERLGLSGASWARDAGVSPNSIYNFLNSRSNSLSQPVLEALARAAGCPVSYLTGESDAAASLPAPAGPGRDEADDVVLIPDIGVATRPWAGASAHPPRPGWPMSRAYLRHALDLGTVEDLAMAVVRGDSMEPVLRAGDRALVDTGDRLPSPPGLFALWEGDAVVIKRIEEVPAAAPPRLRLISDNPRHGAREVAAEGTGIVGRVVWVGRRL